MSAKDCLRIIERMEKKLTEIENKNRDSRESSNFSLSASADTPDAHCDYGWLQTYTGRKIQPFNLKESDIDIIDIAHQLSCIARFLGATKFFYSVAQHSILVSEILELRYKDPMLALWGLLHDGIEYIFFDVPRPLKILPQFQFYREQEKIAMRVLASKFNLMPNDEPELVKLVDKLMLRVENRDLRQPLHPDNHYRFDDEQAAILGVHLIPTIQYKDYLVVKQEFLDRFYCLQNLVSNKKKKGKYMTDNQLSAIEKIAKKQTSLARKAQIALKAGYPVYLSIGAKNSANTDLSTVTKIIITTGIYIKVKTLTGRYWQNLYKDLDNWSFLLPEQIGKKKNNSKNKVEKKG